MIAVTAGEDLCLPRETSKRSRLHDALAIAFEGGSPVAGVLGIGANGKLPLRLTGNGTRAQVVSGIELERICLGVRVRH